jgi:VWFA-related protein
MGRTRPFPGGGLAAALVLLSLGGAPAAAQPQLYGGTTDVVVVEVPVQVVRDGQPVRGLTAADFEVYQGRKKQRITGFEVLDLAAPAAAAAVVPAAARRHFLLLFDLSFSEPKAVLQARAAAASVLDQLHPTDLAAVATYSASRGPQIVLGFTSDRAQVAGAIESLGVPELVNRSGDPLKLVLAEVIAEAESSLTRGGNRGANLSILIDLLDQLAQSSRRADLDTRRNQVAAFTRSFSDLARLMGGVTGRKHVVYLSEGFDSSILTGSADIGDSHRAHTETERAGLDKRVSSEQRFGDTRALNDFEEMLRELRRADCTVQSVDIGGLRAGSDLGFERQGGTDTLLAMARDTGGDLYQSFNDLGEAMRQMLARTGVTYVLSFQPEEVRRDGSYHDLRVELKSPPRGTRLVHRPGYYAPKAYSRMSPLERLLQAADQVMSGEDTGLLPAAVLAAPLPPSPAGKMAYVPVVVEVDGPALLSGIPPGTPLPAEVYVYALDGDGTVHDFVAQTVGLDLAKLETSLLQGGFRFVGHLDLPPGEYSVRVLVRNGITGATGLRVLPVTVPARAEGRPLLLPPLFPRPPGSWPTVREALRQGEAELPYPFRMKEETYVPTPRPLLAPGREARVALIGYHLEEGDLQATARITAADGREVGTGTVRLLERESGDPERLAAVFLPPDLPPGEYRLAVRLTGAAGTVESAPAPFVVGE